MASCGSQSRLVGALSGSLCNLKVGSLNCRGLCNKVKRTELFDYLKKSGLTFIFLQETKFSPFKHEEYEEDWHNSMIFLNSVRGGKGGTGILCNSSSVKILNKLTDNEGCILVMDVDVYGSKFHLVNAYFPTEPYLKEDFIISLYPYLSSNFPVIWCGDHNIVLNPVLDRLPSTNVHDYCSSHLHELIDFFDFVDVCRYIYPNKKIYTFRGPTNRSRIDKVLVSPILNIQGYKQLDLLHSDHDLRPFSFIC